MLKQNIFSKKYLLLFVESGELIKAQEHPLVKLL